MADANAKTRQTRIAAYAVIVDGERMLLCRFSQELLPRLAGKWTLPGGGIEFGETPAAGMIREVAEETGLVVEPISIAHVDSFVEETPERIMHHVRIIYLARVLSGELRHETEGSTDRCHWWVNDDMPPLVDLSKIGVRLAFGKVVP
jgi:ADP-ribose pyrophosphatase YjhB (NUDIX family)